jgi:hypothetical protein
MFLCATRDTICTKDAKNIFLGKPVLRRRRLSIPLAAKQTEKATSRRRPQQQQRRKLDCRRTGLTVGQNEIVETNHVAHSKPHAQTTFHNKVQQEKENKETKLSVGDPIRRRSLGCQLGTRSWHWLVRSAVRRNQLPAQLRKEGQTRAAGPAATFASLGLTDYRTVSFFVSKR